MNDYYKKMDLKYVEKCICKEEFDIHNPGVLKFYVPGLMPFINEGEPTESSIRVSKSHLMNKNKGEINSSGGMACNYMEIELPNWITAVIKNITVESEYTGCIAPEGGGQSDPGVITNTVTREYFLPVDDNDIVPKNQEFIVAFVGGDLNNKKIIGRYS